MNTPREFQALHAEHRAREALAQARSTLERALRELDRYTNRFEEAESLREKADVMNWTLNELACNITPNLRLDLIASARRRVRMACSRDTSGRRLSISQAIAPACSSSAAGCSSAMPT